MHPLLLSALVALALSAPPPCTPDDLIRLPPREVALEAVQFADAHLAWLRGTMPLSVRDLSAWYEQQREAERLREAWYALLYARGYYVDFENGASSDRFGELAPETVRALLSELRELIGDDLYLAGEMPPPVPLWRWHYP